MMTFIFLLVVLFKLLLYRLLLILIWLLFQLHYSYIIQHISIKTSTCLDNNSICFSRFIVDASWFLLIVLKLFSIIFINWFIISYRRDEFFGGEFWRAYWVRILTLIVILFEIQVNFPPQIISVGSSKDLAI